MSRQRHYIIYGLCDPRTNAIRYVGQSINGLYRAREHAGDARRGEVGRKADWIRALQKVDLTYDILVLENVAEERLLDEREIHWIAFYYPTGKLLNLSRGGSVGYKALLPEVRSEVARAREARKSPEARRSVMRKANAAAVAKMMKKTPEERSRQAQVAGRAAAAVRTSEEEVEKGRRWGLAGWAKLTPEERSARGTHASHSRTPEERKRYSEAWWGSLTPEEYAKCKVGHKERAVGVGLKLRGLKGEGVERARTLRATGQSFAAIARQLGVSSGVVRTACFGTKKNNPLSKEEKAVWWTPEQRARYAEMICRRSDALRLAGAGRPKLDERQAETARSMRSAGQTLKAIAQHFKVSPGAVRTACYGYTGKGARSTRLAAQEQNGKVSL